MDLKTRIYAYACSAKGSFGPLARRFNFEGCVSDSWVSTPELNKIWV